MHIPAVLRAEVPNADVVLPIVLGNLLQGSNLSLAQQVHFINGALDHQKRVQEEDSKVFPVKLKSVQRVERQGTKGGLVGVKGLIKFEAKDNGKVVEQEIFTGWLEYNGFDADTKAWELALANSVFSEAEENLGKEAFIRKVFFEAPNLTQGKRVRCAGDIKMKFVAEHTSSAPRSTSSSNRAAKPQLSAHKVEDAVYNGLVDAGINPEGRITKLSSTELNKVVDTICDELSYNDDDALAAALKGSDSDNVYDKAATHFGV